LKRYYVLFVVLAVALVGAVSLAGCSSGKVETSAVDSFSNSSDTTVDTASQADATSSTEVPTTEAATPSTTVTPAKAAGPRVVIETNKGKIVFDMRPDKAPETVANFVKLANKGFYNGTKWHRVEPGFVIQGGDPLSKDSLPQNDGTGGPGYTIKAEFNDLQHLTGTVAMARSQDPDSAGSQFYICLGPQPNLDGQYTVFGQVVEGMDVVNSIQVGDVMNKVYIEKAK
jgi:peptidylprolyl isomerase/peptidyl-prolyl cis-trans isomerase B (cyclophilin B)